MNPMFLLQLGSQIVGTAMNFKQAAQDRRGMIEANKAIDKYMADARRKVNVKEFEDISIDKEMYEAQRVQAQQAAAQMMLQAQEAESRGGAAASGRAFLGLNQNAQGISRAQRQDKRAIDVMMAEQGERNRRMGIGLDLAEVEGAQEASALYQQMYNQDMTGGMKGVGDLIALGYETSGLYPMGNPNKGSGQGSGQGGGQPANPFTQNPFYTIPSGNANLYTPQKPGFVNNGYSFGGVSPFNPF